MSICTMFTCTMFICTRSLHTTSSHHLLTRHSPMHSAPTLRPDEQIRTTRLSLDGLSHWDEEGIPGWVARLCLCPQWTLLVVLCGLCLVHCGLWCAVGSVCGAFCSVLLAKSSSDPHVPSPSCIWSLYSHMEGPRGSNGHSGLSIGVSLLDPWLPSSLASRCHVIGAVAVGRISAPYRP